MVGPNYRQINFFRFKALREKKKHSFIVIFATSAQRYFAAAGEILVYEGTLRLVTQYGYPTVDVDD
jgi:hypothetical protein